MNLTDMNFSKTTLLAALLICTTFVNASIFPVIKRQIETDVKIDTVMNISSETKIYSYFTINQKGLLGTYTEEKTFNNYGDVVSKTQIKRNIPFLGCTHRHTIVSQKTEYDGEGNVYKIHKSKRKSDNVSVMKDVSITFSESGKKIRQNNLKDKHAIKGYQRPNYFQVRAHRMHK